MRGPRPASTEYNLQFAARMRGGLDVPALQAALDGVVRRHEPLRTVVASWPDGPMRQLVLPEHVVPLRPLPAAGGDPERLAAEEAAIPFDLEEQPPVRAGLTELGPD